MSQISVLAGIIQGEAGNPSDQFGVASTFLNRAQAGNFPGGSSPFAVATAAGQYAAYPNGLLPPTPYATSLATDLVNGGNLSSFGNTGNATYYNAPGYNANYASGIGNSYGPGTNQYSDVFNSAPSSNFQMPQPNGSSSVTGDSNTGFASYTDPNAVDTSNIAGQGSDFAPTGIGTGGSNTDFNLGGSDQAVTNTDVPTTLYGNDANIGDNLGSASLVPNSFGATPSYSAADANYSIDSGDAAGNTNTAAIADNPALAGDGSSGFSIGLQTPSDQQAAFGSLPSSSDFSSSNPTSTLANPGQVDTSNIAAMNNPSQSMASVPGTTNSSQFGQTLSGMWEAMGVTATSEGDLGIAKASAQAGQTVSTGINQAATAVDTTNTGLLQSVFTAGSGWLAQGGIILFGLIFLAGGVWFFSRQEA